MRSWLLCGLLLTVSCDAFLRANPSYCEQNSACPEFGTVCDPSLHRCVSLSGPAVVRADPADVLSTGGTTARLTGQNFRPGLQVIIGSDANSPITANVLSATELEFTLPARPAACGLVSITVRTPEGELAPSQASLRYKYGNLSVNPQPLSQQLSFLSVLGAAKINADMHSDLVLSFAINQSISVSLGSGTMTYTFAPGNTGFTDSAYTSLNLVDVDGDGKTDLVGRNSNNVEALQGNGDGTFSGKGRIMMSNNVVSIGELNGQPGLEMILLNPTTNNVLLYKHADGTFFDGANPMLLGGIDSPGSAALIADFIADGSNDIVVPAAAAGNLRTFKGLGSGVFQVDRTVPLSAELALSAVLDVSGDGKPDLIIARNGTPGGELLLGTNSGETFTFESIAQIPPNAAQMFLADFDCDGLKDIALYHRDTQQIQVYSNTGASGFAAAARSINLGRVLTSVVIESLNSAEDNQVDIAGLVNGLTATTQVALFRNVSN